jgi:hypothetical protein
MSRFVQWLKRSSPRGASADTAGRPRLRAEEPLSYAIRKRIPRLLFTLKAPLDGTGAEIDAFRRNHQLGLHETLERVRSERLSLARFGDGEFILAQHADAGIGFQRGSPELQAELSAILRRDGLEGVPVLLAIPTLSKENSYWRHYWAKYWRWVKPLLDLSYVYGNMSVSREGIFKADPERAVAAWRAVWEGRDVCYVIGKGSRFEPLDALFGGVASHRTIYSTPKHAYEDLPRLIEEIVANVPRETLILIALGPTATVLAVRLARLGYWALDLGHITSAYRTVVQGAPMPEKTPFVAAD